MPQYTEPPQHMTPFAQVLVDYMWNKRPRNSPPLSYSQLAIRLGIPKQSVSNWILRGSVPPLDTIMVILAKLRIPLRDLYNAYVQSELPAPAWDAADLARITAAEQASQESGATPTDEPATPRKRKPATAIYLGDTTGDAPAPLPYRPPASLPSQDEEWELIVRNTQATLRNEGVSEEAIAAVVADLRRQQRGKSTPIQRSMIAEHAEAPTEPASNPTSEADARHPERKSRTGSKQTTAR